MLTPEEEERFLKCIRDYDRNGWDTDTKRLREHFLGENPGYSVLVEGFLRANEREQSLKIYLEQLVKREVDGVRAQAANSTQRIVVGMAIILAATGPALLLIDKVGSVESVMLATGAMTAFCIVIGVGVALNRLSMSKFKDGLHRYGGR